MAEVERLLEREPALDALRAAVAEAAAGRGSTVLLTGDAGIGKTSVIRAFLAALDRRVRVLAGMCDDLLAPRTLGPLRDAARGSSGPLERALVAQHLVVEQPGDMVFGAIVEELAGAALTVLVVEDVHWADDATLDVLRYVARRLGGLRAVLVLTFRDDSVDAVHPLQHLLGGLAGAPVHRISLLPLSEAAVGALCAGTDRDGAAVHGLTGGNPFYVTEALAAPPDAVPPTITDTVLARLCRLSPDCRLALEQLSVAPTRVSLELVEELLGGLADALAEAEEHAIIEVGADGIAFRHELARRAVEHSLPTIRRRALHREMVRALRVQRQPDLARLVHHGVAATDAATVAEYAPRAGLEAAHAGAHRQALAHYEAALRRPDLLGAPQRAQVLDAYAWELYNAHRFTDAVMAGREAVARYRELEDPVALGETLLRLSRYLYMAGDTDESEQAVDRAVQVLTSAGCPQAVAQASAHRGAILALTDRSEDAVTTLEQARDLAAGLEQTDLVALCLNYLGVARADLGAPDGLVHLRESLAMARRGGFHEYAARAYVNFGAILYRFGRYDELAECLDAGLRFTRERGFWHHAYNLEVQRCLLLLRQGAWSAAEDGLRALVDGTDDPGMLYVYSVPALGRLLARRGRPDAEKLLMASWERAVAQRSSLGLAYAGIALVEWAWLNGRPDRARAVCDVLLPRTQQPGAAPLRGELLRYLARAGLGGMDFAGCPEVYAAGLRGDWRAAASEWDRIGGPYERALELAESGEPEPTLEALRVLDELDASAVAGLVRRRLQDMGIPRVPRGPRPATRANPAGLTARQVDVLTLIRRRMTNAEIAESLVLSVRTVEHHVSAILAKLGAQSRTEAAATAEAKIGGPAPNVGGRLRRGGPSSLVELLA